MADPFEQWPDECTCDMMVWPCEIHDTQTPDIVRDKDGIERCK